MDDVSTLAARAARAQDPGEGMRAVVELRGALDELEARHVDGAVERGWSWAQIGRSLGISRQAAHHRHGSRPAIQAESPRPVPKPSEEPRVVITGTARDVVARARREAARLGADATEPDHLLVALLQAPAGPARDALLQLGADLEEARAELPADGHPGPAAQPPEISRATRALLEQSLHESQRLCHGHLGPEHLLLALLHDDGPGVELLTRLGATPGEVEAAVCEVLKNTDFARSL
jgi:hypothetical protein